MVMLAAGMRGLEAGGPVDVEAMDEPERRQHLERAVDAREARRPAVGGAEAIVDLLSAQAAALALEQHEDLLTGAAGAMAGPRKLSAGVLPPVRAVLVGMAGRHRGQPSGYTRKREWFAVPCSSCAFSSCSQRCAPRWPPAAARRASRPPGEGTG